MLSTPFPIDEETVEKPERERAKRLWEKCESWKNCVENAPYLDDVEINQMYH